MWNASNQGFLSEILVDSLLKFFLRSYLGFFPIFIISFLIASFYYTFPDQELKCQQTVKIHIQIRNVIAPTEQCNNLLCYHIHNSSQLLRTQIGRKCRTKYNNNKTVTKMFSFQTSLNGITHTSFQQKINFKNPLLPQVIQFWTVEIKMLFSLCDL